MGYDVSTVTSTPAEVFRNKFESIKPNSDSVLSKKKQYLEKLYAL